MAFEWRARPRSSSRAGWAFLAGALTGGLAVVLLDTRRGRARRAWLGQKAQSAAREARVEAQRRIRAAAKRAAGRAYEARHAQESVPDDVLVERVRAQIGRPVKHARALRVEAHDGAVVLAGPILRGEVQPLLETVGKVRGVHRIENRLEVHDDSGTTPGLQS